MLAAFPAPVMAPSESFQTAAPPQAVSETATFLAADYLPLNLGNRWIYQKKESRFKKTDTLRIEIISTPIIH